MIDKTTLAAGLATLAGAFGREVDGPVVAAYYAVLSPQLSTEQFEHAVQRALREETFWPSPAVLLAKVQAPALEQGVAALRHVNATMGRFGGFQYLPYDVYAREFDAPTKAAIQAVGGLREIANVHEDRYPALQRKFAEAYQRALASPPALPAPDADPRVTRLVCDVVSGRDLAAGDGRPLT